MSCESRLIGRVCSSMSTEKTARKRRKKLQNSVRKWAKKQTSSKLGVKFVPPVPPVPPAFLKQKKTRAYPQFPQYPQQNTNKKSLHFNLPPDLEIYPQHTPSKIFKIWGYVSINNINTKLTFISIYPQFPHFFYISSGERERERESRANIVRHVLIRGKAGGTGGSKK